jgi:phospholipid-binding lipoprotein MlaA
MNLSNLSRTALVMLAVTLSGCATNDPRDPLEPLNRGIYKFNDTVDKAVTKPIAQGYRAVLPSPVRTSVTNFFSNIDDIFVTANNLLQFKIHSAASDFARLVTNTTFGIGGLFDVATSFGLEKHNEDFGQTLGYWGAGDGAFLMLPLLGPSDVRDAIGTGVQGYLNPVWNLNDVALRNSLTGLNVVDDRANLLDAEKVLDEAALDPYTFLRDAYLQQRRSLVYDGNPPREDLSDSDNAPVNKSAASGIEGTDKAAEALPATPAVKEEKAESAPATEKAAATEGAESNGFTTLVSWLFGGRNTAAGQE